MNYDMNRVTMLGRCGADPEMLETKTGRKLTRFPLATHQRIAAVEIPPLDDSENEEGSVSSPSRPAERTHWHRVVAWGKAAELCQRFLKSGDRVLVEGSLIPQRYTGKDGVERFGYQIHVDQVRFLEKRAKVIEVEVETEAVSA